MDYEDLRQGFPETISMEQFYKIAHISKRKARWLLENGVVPCEDNGKKTNRFQIRMDDVILFLQRRAAGELAGVIPTGAFSSGVAREVPAQAYLDSEELTAYLLAQWGGRARHADHQASGGTLRLCAHQHQPLGTGGSLTGCAVLR